MARGGKVATNSLVPAGLAATGDADEAHLIDSPATPRGGKVVIDFRTDE
jgi:hypothetical protein